MPLLSAIRLRHAFPGSARPAFGPLDFRVEAGEIVGLVGPSGPESSGKSTILRIAAGLIRDYQGDMLFQGKELKEWSRDYFERIGAALQSPLIDTRLTPKENLEWAAGLYRSRSGKADAGDGLLAALGLSPSAEIRADKLDGDARKRLSIARALLHGPELVLLDEPWRGLGPDSAGKVSALLKARKAGGGSILLSTEDAALARVICDRVIDLPAAAATIGKAP